MLLYNIMPSWRAGRGPPSWPEALWCACRPSRLYVYTYIITCIIICIGTYVYVHACYIYICIQRDRERERERERLYICIDTYIHMCIYNIIYTHIHT